MKNLHLEPREVRAIRNAFRHFLPILCIAVFTAVFLTGYLGFQDRQRSIMQTQEHLVAEAQNNYNNYIVNLVSIVHMLEINYVEAVVEGATKQEIETIFTNGIVQSPTIDQLRILDVNGMEMIRVNRGEQAPYVVPENELQDKSDRYYYLETRQLGRDHLLFSVLDLNIELGKIEIAPKTGLAKPTFRISKPVVINEERIGYFVVNFLMRDYLTALRSSTGLDGVKILLFDQNGYLLNDEDDRHNFGFSYEDTSEEAQYTIADKYPKTDLTAESGWKVENNEMYYYAGYSNIKNLSDTYFLSENASGILYFLVSFNQQSIYGKYIHFSLLQSIADSWRIQVPVILTLILLYFTFIWLGFLSNRAHFTNTYSDNRFDKSVLKKALHNHEFVSYFQPIINIQDGTVLGFEALARWDNGKEVLTPDKFMDEIENYELSEELDRNTYNNIRKARQKLTALGITDYEYISINISQQSFNSMLKENSGNTIQLDEEDKKYMLVELLENIIIHKKSANKIFELHSQNVRFAIDDFGTGNSNIAFIRNFVDLSVKIDKAFLPKDIHNEKERVVIEAFVRMFLDKGRKLIVEGVESREQYQYLKKLRVSGIQGFYFAKPLSLDQLVEFMQQKEYLQRLA